MNIAPETLTCHKHGIRFKGYERCPYCEAENAPKPDMVNNPPHYTKGGVECIDALESMTAGMDGPAGFLAGNVVKYVWRHPHKSNPVEDLKKARWYLDRLIAQLENSSVPVEPGLKQT